MKLKLFLQIVSVVLTVKVVFGVAYILMGWNIAISGWIVPVWLVVVAVAVDGASAYLACKFSKGKK